MGVRSKKHLNFDNCTTPIPGSCLRPGSLALLQAETTQFNLDWQRVGAKARFRKLVGINDKGVKTNGDRLEEELAEVRMAMAK